MAFLALCVVALIVIFGYLFATGQLGNVLPQLINGLKPHKSGISVDNVNDLVTLFAIVGIAVLVAYLITGWYYNRKINFMVKGEILDRLYRYGSKVIVILAVTGLFLGISNLNLAYAEKKPTSTPKPVKTVVVRDHKNEPDPCKVNPDSCTQGDHGKGKPPCNDQAQGEPDKCNPKPEVTPKPDPTETPKPEVTPITPTPKPTNDPKPTETPKNDSSTAKVDPKPETGKFNPPICEVKIVYVYIENGVYSMSPQTLTGYMVK